MTKFVHSDPSKTLELYDAQIAAHPTIERKGAKNPYTSVNGHMFSCMNKDGEVGVRFEKKEQEAMIEKYHAKQFMSYGAKMRWYVAVPISVLESEKFHEWLDRSYAYVTSLEPKPTKKTKK